MAPRHRPPPPRGTATVQRDPEVELPSQCEDPQRDPQVSGESGRSATHRREHATVLGGLLAHGNGPGLGPRGARAPCLGRALGDLPQPGERPRGGFDPSAADHPGRVAPGGHRGIRTRARSLNSRAERPPGDRFTNPPSGPHIFGAPIIFLQPPRKGPSISPQVGEHRLPGVRRTLPSRFFLGAGSVSARLRSPFRGNAEGSFAPAFRSTPNPWDSHRPLVYALLGPIGLTLSFD